ncbi:MULTISPECIES: hypothetical protein [Mesoflavibacter]|uniref:Uncharacterized protein n=1 Tax=Mesoflavibacter profundi TaxID=2708110 RepID=A0ABT4S1R1_9FLAO|nr:MULTISPECIES: hypothetical protein [Mesoflavibacter]MDA0178005.1 hypothetical protein [Mesoflavibacter profundi]QIJ88966.1 hypothetical protein C7H62_1157 [Mesoflavibacter sp. HG96]QIJ91694.1 hypothetical protein C7H56_1157 [Mesoflavibacter sp. HG37]
MKKKLESELISIAHRILKLGGKEDVNKMHAEVAALYEKLTVLKFANENFEDDMPTIGNDSSFFGMLDTAFNNKISDNIEVDDKIYINLDDVEEDEITEPLMEKIKDMVAQMPQESQKVDELINEVLPKKEYHKNDFEEITAGFDKMPVFEPISEVKTTEKKSLNDKFNNGLNIGLNDKLAFIKHLFDGSTEDYNRVLSQLNTTTDLTEATHLIRNVVKPDYNNWEGKEDYEARFMQIVEARFDQ